MQIAIGDKMFFWDARFWFCPKSFLLEDAAASPVPTNCLYRKDEYVVKELVYFLENINTIPFNQQKKL